MSPQVDIEEEKILDNTLRPLTLNEFIGQAKIKEKLKIFITAALTRKESLDHCLFYSPPGLGKTTLAYIISKEMGVNIRPTSGPVIDKAGDLAAILTSLEENDVLFIDEIHRLNKTIEETLYQAMEDFTLDLIIGSGPSARTQKLSLPHFTLIGATTRAGLLTSPLRNRFGISLYIDFYPVEELYQIVRRSANILNIEIDEEGAQKIALSARGTPRIANRLLKRIRDYAQVKGDGKITLKIAQEGLKMLEIDDQGLDQLDRKILKTIIEKFSGGPVGIETISIAVNEEIDTITEICEPYLIQKGFIARTPRGRVATKLAYQHLKIKNFGNSQNELFLK